MVPACASNSAPSVEAGREKTPMVRRPRLPVLVAATAGVLALVLPTGGPANAQTGGKCLAGKLRAIGKKERGLLNCEAKVAATGANSGRLGNALRIWLSQPSPASSPFGSVPATRPAPSSLS